MPIAYIVSLVPLAVLALGAGLAHFEVAPPLTGFIVFLLGAALGIGVAVVLAVLRVRGTVPITLPIGLALLPLGFVVLGAAPGIRYPRINDITTDLVTPPPFAKLSELPENKGRNMTFPPAFAPLIRAGYPDLKPLAIPGITSGEAFDHARMVAGQQPYWTLRAVDPPARTIEGTAMTHLFHFRDDFVIHITQSSDGVVIDMRSKSRDGQGDFGANAKRIRSFLDQVAQHIRANATTPGTSGH